MRTKLHLILTGIVSLLFTTTALRADVLEMQNGDRYSGKVLSVTADTVVLNSEILGKINVPRGKVAMLKFADAPAAPKPGANIVVTRPPSQPIAAPAVALTATNLDLSTAIRQLGGSTNFISQIRQQMLADSPEAAGAYDQMVSGLMSGQINLADLRRQAQSSAKQLRDLKKDLGSDADESLDAYLKILDAFVNETVPAPSN